MGIYESRSRAASWDGRNAQGEPVASGVYFYTLTAGDFSVTRKMLIQTINSIIRPYDSWDVYVYLIFLKSYCKSVIIKVLWVLLYENAL